MVAGMRLTKTLGLKIGSDELLAEKDKDAASRAAAGQPQLERAASITESTTVFMPPIKEPAYPPDASSKRDTNPGPGS